MRIEQFQHFRNATPAAAGFASLVACGKLVDVSSFAARIFGGKQVGIDATTHERFVEWSNAAMRRHGVHLDQRHRLMSLLESSCYAAMEPGGSSFICRAVDAYGFDSREQRHIFSLKDLGVGSKPAWRISCG